MLLVIQAADSSSSVTFHRPAGVVEAVLVVELVVGDLLTTLGKLVAVSDDATRRLGPLGTARIRLFTNNYNNNTRLSFSSL